jgi:hypothetical protein
MEMKSAPILRNAGTSMADESPLRGGEKSQIKQERPVASKHRDVTVAIVCPKGF